MALIGTNNRHSAFAGNTVIDFARALLPGFPHQGYPLKPGQQVKFLPVIRPRVPGIQGHGALGKHAGPISGPLHDHMVPIIQP